MGENIEKSAKNWLKRNYEVSDGVDAFDSIEMFLSATVTSLSSRRYSFVIPTNLSIYFHPNHVFCRSWTNRN